MSVTTSRKQLPDAAEGIVGLDRQLVDLLHQDGRISYADLANNVGLSADAVRERLKRLEAHGKIRIVGSVSSGVLGYESFALVAIKVHGSSSREAARRIAEIPAVDLVVCVSGMYDIVAQVVCKNDSELLTVIDDDMRSIPNVTVQEVFSYLTVEKYSAGFDEGHQSRTHGPPPMLDDADRALIWALQADGRASFRELQEASGLTYTSTRRRVKALFDSGLVRIVTIENQLSMGAQVQAGVGLTIQGPIEDVRSVIMAIPGVEMAVTAAGSFDLLLEVTVADKAALAELTGQRLRDIPGVVGTHTFQYLDVVKLPYTWAGLEHAPMGR